jgi:PRTRC genetic system protein B
MTTETKTDLPSPFQKALPKAMKIGRDQLLLRLDFYTEAIVMQSFDKKGNGGSYKMVSAHDLGRALSAGMSFASGLLPENALWWANTKNGSVVAIWVPPGIRRLGLQTEGMKVLRYNVPLPGLIFICRPGVSPYVYAATERPAAPKDKVYKAPLANVYDDGRTCPGDHKYPTVIADIPDSFFRSFFSRGADLGGRSKKHPKDIIEMWKDLDKKEGKEYPISDLQYHGTIGDLMAMSI